MRNRLSLLSFATYDGKWMAIRLSARIVRKQKRKQEDSNAL